MAHENGDRNLLFGILALQMDFIERDALIRAMHAWVLDKSKSLGQILVEQQALGNETQALLDAVVQQHIRQHGDDAEKSLASVRSLSSLREELERIVDPDVLASLAHVPSTGDLGATGPYAPPSAGSDSVGASSEVGRRFRVLRPHAEGGLGKVSVARDEELHRDVALKEIKEHHADHPESRARFLVEAEITGGLEHPGIVPVYGLGAYADGRPFYAMRFIQGDSLKDAVQRFHQTKGPLTAGPRALELRQLLTRFNNVCDAIAYAHSRGLLHRDLKPANVMLGKYGETLVVDWGLAKPIGDRSAGEDRSESPLRPASAGDASPTQYGQAVGTPAYMAPEQAAGRLDQLGPPTDVYSLGATLYCLLTGKAPFERGDKGGVLQRVQRGEFPRPRQVRRDVPMALEAVCLKAMALRPEDRYVTPKALAEDVEKWRADEPTTAYREPWRVRTWRWVKRHRTPVTATAAAAVAVLALGSVLLWTILSQRWELARETTAELAAVRELRDQGRFTEAKAAMARLEHLLSRGDPAGLADRARQARKDLDMAADLDEVPLLATQSVRENTFDQEAVVQRYRELFRRYGIDPATLDPAEAALRIRASEIEERLIVALDYWASKLPTRDREWSHLVEAAGLADGDDRRKGLRQAWSQADVQALERRLDGWEISSLPTTTAVVIGSVLLRKGSAARAEQLLRAVQHVHPNDFWVNHGLYETLYVAPAHAEEAVGFLRAAVAVKPDSSEARSNLGVLLYHTGRSEEAEKEFRRAILLNDEDAKAHDNLGHLLADAGRVQEAEKEYRRAVQIQDTFELVHNSLGLLLQDTGRWEEAEKEYRRAIQIKDDSPVAHSNLGLLLYGAGRREEAEKEFCRAVQLDDNNGEYHKSLGVVMAGAGRLEEAEKEFRRAIQLNDNDAKAHDNLGVLLAGERRRDEAEKEFRRALQIKENLAEIHNNLGGLLIDEGRKEEAEKECRRAIQIKEDYPEAHANL
ncbi:MAG TPA: tetratricopeptide repeat protein, partial [Gemmataceae bacterium]|nr:tetratricopeptide repeat protein [Gemmataceae bacterium]